MFIYFLRTQFVWCDLLPIEIFYQSKFRSLFIILLVNNNIILNSYECTTCRMVHDRQFTDTFQVKTGVRQGFLLSPFLLAIDWVMKTYPAHKRNCIEWTHLDDLDLATIWPSSLTPSNRCR